MRSIKQSTWSTAKEHHQSCLILFRHENPLSHIADEHGMTAAMSYRVRSDEISPAYH